MTFSRKLICAIDRSDLEEAKAVVQRMAPWVGGFKIGHALTLNYGLSVVAELRDAGAARVFVDLKFHDIPNSVALAVREAGRHGAWMMTLHASGGPAMMQAAAEQAHAFPEESRPLLVGVSVLTSLDERTLAQLGVQRSLQDHVVSLSELALQNDLDGVVCSAHEIVKVREALGPSPIVVTPGIRAADADRHDQKRIGQAKQALDDGANYLVVGRALTDAENPEFAIEKLGIA